MVTTKKRIASFFISLAMAISLVAEPFADIWQLLGISTGITASAAALEWGEGMHFIIRHRNTVPNEKMEDNVVTIEGYILGRDVTYEIYHGEGGGNRELVTGQDNAYIYGVSPSATSGKGLFTLKVGQELMFYAHPYDEEEFAGFAVSAGHELVTEYDDYITVRYDPDVRLVKAHAFYMNRGEYAASLAQLVKGSDEYDLPNERDTINVYYYPYSTYKRTANGDLEGVSGEPIIKDDEYIINEKNAQAYIEYLFEIGEIAQIYYSGTYYTRENYADMKIWDKVVLPYTKFYNNEEGLHTDKTASISARSDLFDNDGRTFDLDLEAWYIGADVPGIALILDASGSMAYTSEEPAKIKVDTIINNYLANGGKIEDVLDGDFIKKEFLNKYILDPLNTDNAPISVSDYKYYIYDPRDDVNEYTPLKYIGDDLGYLIPQFDKLIGYYGFNRGDTTKDTDTNYSKTARDWGYNSVSNGTVSDGKATFAKVVSRQSTDSISFSEDTNNDLSQNLTWSNVPVKFDANKGFNLKTSTSGLMLDVAPEGDFTISFKIVNENETGTVNDLAEILYIGEKAPDNSNYFRAVRESGTNSARFRGYKGNSNSASDRVINANTIFNQNAHIITLVYKDGKLTTYNNGQLAISSGDATAENESQPLVLDGYNIIFNGLTNSYNGGNIFIDEIYVFDAALDESKGEVSALYDFATKSGNTNLNYDGLAVKNEITTQKSGNVYYIEYNDGKIVTIGDNNAFSGISNFDGWYYVNFGGNNWTDSYGSDLIGTAEQLYCLEARNDIEYTYSSEGTPAYEYERNNISYKPNGVFSPFKFFVDEEGYLRCFYSSNNNSSASSMENRYGCSYVYEKADDAETKVETLQRSLGTFVSTILESSSQAEFAATRFSVALDQTSWKGNFSLNDLTKLVLLDWTSNPIESDKILNVAYGGGKSTVPTKSEGDAVTDRGHDPIDQYNYGLTGGTNTYTGLASFIQNLHKRADKEKNKYIVIFTDGKDTEFSNILKGVKDVVDATPDVSEAIAKTGAYMLAEALRDEDAARKYLTDSKYDNVYLDHVDTGKYDKGLHIKLKDVVRDLFEQDENGDLVTDENGEYIYTGGYTIFTVLLAAGQVSATSEKDDYRNAVQFLTALSGEDYHGAEDLTVYNRVFAASAAGLEAAFQAIADEISNDLKEYTVQDYIDPRFNLVDADGNTWVLSAEGQVKIVDANGNESEPELWKITGTDKDSDGKIVDIKEPSDEGKLSDKTFAYINLNADSKIEGNTAMLYFDASHNANMYYLVWNHQTIPSSAKSEEWLAVWNSKVTVRAKDDFIGGNAVLSNGNGQNQNYVYQEKDSGASSDPNHGNGDYDPDNDLYPSKGFPRTAVNIEVPELKIIGGNQVIFLGEELTPAGVAKKLGETINDQLQERVGSSASWYWDYLHRYAADTNNNTTYTSFDDIIAAIVATADPENPSYVDFPYYYISNEEGTTQTGSKEHHEKDLFGIIRFSWTTNASDLDVYEDYPEEVNSDHGTDARDRYFRVSKLMVEYLPMPIDVPDPADWPDYPFEDGKGNSIDREDVNRDNVHDENDTSHNDAQIYPWDSEYKPAPGVEQTRDAIVPEAAQDPYKKSKLENNEPYYALKDKDTYSTGIVSGEIAFKVKISKDVLEYLKVYFKDSNGAEIKLSALLKRSYGTASDPELVGKYDVAFDIQDVIDGKIDPDANGDVYVTVKLAGFTPEPAYRYINEQQENGKPLEYGLPFGDYTIEIDSDSLVLPNTVAIGEIQLYGIGGKSNLVKDDNDLFDTLGRQMLAEDYDDDFFAALLKDNANYTYADYARNVAAKIEKGKFKIGTFDEIDGTTIYDLDAYVDALIDALERSDDYEYMSPAKQEAAKAAIRDQAEEYNKARLDRRLGYAMVELTLNSGALEINKKVVGIVESDTYLFDVYETDSNGNKVNYSNYTLPDGAYPATIFTPVKNSQPMQTNVWVKFEKGALTGVYADNNGKIGGFISPYIALEGIIIDDAVEPEHILIKNLPIGVIMKAVEVKNAPAGSIYGVYKYEEPTYVDSENEEDGKVTITSETTPAAPASITAINTAVTGNMEIYKIVEGDIPKGDENRKFKFTITEAYREAENPYVDHYHTPEYSPHEKDFLDGYYKAVITTPVDNQASPDEKIIWVKFEDGDLVNVYENKQEVIDGKIVDKVKDVNEPLKELNEEGEEVEINYISLKGGEHVTIYALPSGTQYTVTEINANKYGYVTIYDGDTDKEKVTGEIPEGDIPVKVSVTNEFKTGDLKLSKEITGVDETSQEGKERLREDVFKFDIELRVPVGTTIPDPAKYIGTYTKTLPNGTLDESDVEVILEGQPEDYEVEDFYIFKAAGIELGHNGYITFKGLPLGTEYTITEEVDPDYVAGYSINGEEPEKGYTAEGEIEDNESNEPIVENVKYINELTPGSVKVIKTVGEGYIPDNELNAGYNFTMEAYTMSGSNKIPLTGKYDAKIVSESGDETEIEINFSSDGDNVGFYNFNLKAGETLIIEDNLPVGTKIVITEVVDSDIYTTKINGNGTINGLVFEGEITSKEKKDPETGEGTGEFETVGVEVTYENTRKTGDVEITKKLTPAEGTIINSSVDNDVQFEFTVVSIVDGDGNPLNGEYDYTIGNTAGKFAVGRTFILKADQTIKVKGLPVGAVVTVKETRVIPSASGTYNDKQYKISEENVEITVAANTQNSSGTYVTPDANKAEVENIKLAPVKVSLEGTKTYEDGTIETEMERFAFTITPANTVDDPISRVAGYDRTTNSLTVYNDATGKIEFFKNLEYSVPGTYTYTVSETAGSKPYIDYAATVYTVTVEIEDRGDGVLESKITVDGSDAVVFNNTYLSGSLTIKKTVTDTGINETYKFTVVHSGTDTVPAGTYNAHGIVNGNSVQSVVFDANGDLTTINFSNNAAPMNGLSLKNGDYITIEGLPVGVALIVTEDTSANSYEYDTEYNVTGGTSTEENGSVTVTITANGEEVTVDTENTVKMGSLKLSKEVTGDNAPTDDEFTFEIKLWGPDGAPVSAPYTYTIEGENEKLYTNGTITLKDGQTAVFEGLYVGTTYEITEAQDDNYATSISVNDGTAAAGRNTSGEVVETANSNVNTVKYTNEYLSGKLTVSKEVTGIPEGEAAETEAFGFTVSEVPAQGSVNVLDGKTYNATITDGTTSRPTTVTFPNAEFALKHGESITIVGLPVGVELKVEETSTGTTYSYNTKYKVGSGTASSEPAQVTISGTSEITVAVENAVSKGQLAITKTIANTSLSSDGDFTFKVTLKDSNGNELSGSYAYDINGAEQNDPIVSGGTIELKAGETATIKGLPQGTEYTVEEVLPANSDYELVSVNGVNGADKATGNIGETEESAVFTNNYLTGSVTITKTVTGDLQESDTYEFTLTQTDGDIELNGEYTATSSVSGDTTVTFSKDAATGDVTATITLAKDEVLTIEGLPFGTELTISEDSTFGYTVNYTDNPVTINSETSDATVTVENVLNTGSLEISKTVTGDGAPDDDEFEFTVTLTGPDGTTALDGEYDYTIYLPSPSGAVITGRKIRNGGTITLKNGEKAVIEGLPENTKYTVSETAHSDYTTSAKKNGVAASNKVSGTIGTGTETAAYTNSYKSGNLVISKNVTGLTSSEDAETAEFSFTLTADEDSKAVVGGKTYTAIKEPIGNTDEANQTAVTVEFNSDGTAEVKLADGYQITIIGLPLNAKITVEEDASGMKYQYTPKYNGEADPAEAVISTADMAEINVENAVDRADLEISKTVEGNDVPANELTDGFRFTITLHGPDGSALSGTYEVEGIDETSVTFNNGTASVTIAHGQTAKIIGLPAGATYTVTEENDNDRLDNYTTEVNGDPGESFDGITGTDGTVEFVNSYLMGALTITKTVDGDLRESEEYSITITDTAGMLSGTYGDATFNNGVATVKLRAGESAVIDELPYGITLTVEEDTTVYTYEKTYKVNGVETSAPEFTIDSKSSEVSVEIINKIGTGKLEVSKEVTGIGAPTDGVFKFDVVLTTPDGLNALNGTYYAVISPVEPGEANMVEITGGRVTINLRDGQTATIEGLPEGARYFVSETADSDYSTIANRTVTETKVNGEIVSYNVNGTIDADGEKVKFTNIYGKTGSVSITKTLNDAGNNALTAEDKNFEFSFNAEFSIDGLTEFSGIYYIIDSNGNVTTAETSFSDVSGISFKLKAGETIIISDLPLGTTVTVTENEITGNSSYKYIADGNTYTIVTSDEATLPDTAKATVVNTKRVHASVSLDAVKTYEDGTLESGMTETFEFVITPVTGNSELDPIAEAKTVYSDENGLIKLFEDAEYFIDGGVYKYTVHEIPGDKPYIDYDETVYTVTVKINDDGTGVLQSTVTITKPGANGAEETVDSITFNNEYLPGSLTISKKVVGTTESEAFKFDVVQVGDVEIPDGTYDASGNAARYLGSGLIEGTIDSVEFKDGKLIKVTFDDTTTSDALYITSNHYVTIKGLPFKAQLKVTEDKSGLKYGYDTEYAASTAENIVDVVEDEYAVVEIINSTDKIARVDVTNTLKTVSLSISKTVTGVGAEDNAVFEFVVKLYDASGTELTDSYTYKILPELPNGTTQTGTITSGGSILLSDGQTAVIADLISGTLVEVSETNNDKYAASYVIDGGSEQNSNNVGRTKLENDMEISFTNKFKEGNLTVKKTVEGLHETNENPFRFTITSDDDTFSGTYTAEGGVYTEVTFNGGKATVELTNGQSVTIVGLPDGMTFTVEEVDVDTNNIYKYTTSYIGSDSATIEDPETAEIEVKNIVKKGTVTISKTVEGNIPDSEQNRAFEFTVTAMYGADEIPLNGTYPVTIDGEDAGSVTFVNGVSESPIRLTNGQTAVINDIPAGTAVKVVETAVDGYVTMIGSEKTNEFNGTIADDGDNADVSVTNTYAPGSLSVTKTAVGEKSDTVEDFEFKVTFTGDTSVIMVTKTAADGTTSEFSFADLTDGEFTLKSGETITFTNLTLGKQYTVTEENYFDDGYSTVIVGDASSTAGRTAVGTITEADDTVEIEYINTNPAVGSINVTKELESFTGDTQEFEFTVEITDLPENLVDIDRIIQVSDAEASIVANADGSVTITFTLTGGKTVNIYNIPISTAGTNYTVTEKPVDGYKMKYAVKDSGTLTAGTAAGLSADVVFTNALLSSFEITKEVAGLPDDETALETYQLTIEQGNNGADAISGSYDAVRYKGEEKTAEEKVEFDAWTHKANITLGRNERLVIEGLPYGTELKVEEALSGMTYTYDDPEYTPSQTVTTGSGTVTVAVKNTVKTGSLALTKLIEGDGALTSDTFTFEVTLKNSKGEALTGTYSVTGTDDYTFNGDGTVSITVKGGQTVTIDDLPIGTTYSIREVDSEGYELVSVNGAAVSDPSAAKAEGTVSSASGAAATFTNKFQSGKLTISKSVKMSDGSELPVIYNDEEFEFTVVLENENGEPIDISRLGYSKDPETTDEDEAKAEITFLLTNGENVEISGIPDGTKYTVTETGKSGYVATPESAEGTMNGNASAAFTNTKQVGSLTVSKTVKMFDESALTDAEKDAEFEFTVAFTGLTMPDEAKLSDILIGVDKENIDDTNNTVKITLKHGESFTIKGIPAGTGYTVTEAPYADYVPAAEGDEGTIGVNAVSEAKFVNTRKLDIGTLTISKKVTGSRIEPDVDHAKDFEFKITFGNLPKNFNYSDIKVNNEPLTGSEYTFTLKHNESITFENIPKNVEYTIAETEYENYTAYAETNDTDPEQTNTITGRINDKGESVTVTFTNKKANGMLKIMKYIKGNISEDEEFRFEVVLTDKDGKPLTGSYSYFISDEPDTIMYISSGNTITLKGGQYALIYGLPEGTEYTVSEMQGDYDTAKVNETGTIVDNDTQTATFVNGRPEDPKTPAPGEGLTELILTKYTAWLSDGSDLAERFKFRITFIQSEDNGDIAGGDMTEPGTSDNGETAGNGNVDAVKPDDTEATASMISELNGDSIAVPFESIAEGGEIVTPDNGETVETDNDETTEPDSGETTEPDSGETTEPDSGETTEPGSGETTEPDSGETTEPDSGETTEPDGGETGPYYGMISISAKELDLSKPIEVYLGHGESIRISDLPVGIKYIIEEVDLDESVYRSSIEGGKLEGTLDANGENISVVNVRLTDDADIVSNSLTVSKKVVSGNTGSELKNDKNAFEFIISFNPLFTITPDNVEDGSTSYEMLGDGSMRVLLKTGESITIKNIPDGTTYTVTETAVNGYTSKVTSGNASGTVSGGNVKVEFTNVKDPEPVTPPPPSQPDDPPALPPETPTPPVENPPEDDDSSSGAGTEGEEDELEEDEEADEEEIEEDITLPPEDEEEEDVKETDDQPNPQTGNSTGALPAAAGSLLMLAAASASLKKRREDDEK